MRPSSTRKPGGDANISSLSLATTSFALGFILGCVKMYFPIPYDGHLPRTALLSCRFSPSLPNEISWGSFTADEPD